MHKFHPQALLLDMDGVLFHGDSPLPDASDFLQHITHLPHAFITNNPIRTQEQIVENFVRMGLPRPDPALIVTSALATADWLARSKPESASRSLSCLRWPWRGWVVMRSIA